jgi:opacity protein-like surface antigen
MCAHPKNKFARSKTAMRASVLCTLFAAFLLWSPSALRAQDDHRFNLSAGAGFSVPAATASANLNTGWNLDFRGGLNVNPSFLADLDFNYNRWNLTSRALARFAEPGGYADVWSLTFVPVIRVAPHRRIDPYILGGAGLYHRGITLTQPALLNTFYCDPFFGFCYPATVQGSQVVASFSTYKFGFNAGGGLEFGLGTHNLKIFAESRYNEMFTTHGSNLIYWPVTFGLRW